MQIPVILIFGATASGKTDFAVSTFGSDSTSGLANTCEVINADSVQVYWESRIVSARPTSKECKKLPHHLVAVRNGDEEFSVSDFVKEADKLCLEIFQRNKIPLLLGGSAFFLKNFLLGLPKTPKANPEVRNRLQHELSYLGEQAMYERLQLCDPTTASRIKPADHYRILRALEVYETSKKPLSSFELPTKFRKTYDFLILTFSRPREMLYKRIEDRVDGMFKAGLFEEFCNLYKKGYRAESPIMKAIGYSEFFLIHDVEPINLNSDELKLVKNLIKRDTRRYAKRQETFFKKIPKNFVINLDKKNEVDFAIQKIKDFMTKVR